MTFLFYIFPLDNISSTTTRTAFLIAEINKIFKIIICVHHNLEVSVFLLLQRTEIISAALFVIPHLDQPLKRFEIEHLPPTKRFVHFYVTLFICIEKLHNKCSKYPPFAIIQALAYLKTAALAFLLRAPHTKCISAYFSVYSGIVNDCNLCRQPIKIRSSQSVDFDSSQFRIVTKQSFLNRNIFFVNKTIFQQSQNSREQFYFQKTVQFNQKRSKGF
jgi:hypothetical protein